MSEISKVVDQRQSVVSHDAKVDSGKHIESVETVDGTEYYELDLDDSNIAALGQRGGRGIRGGRGVRGTRGVRGARGGRGGRGGSYIPYSPVVEPAFNEEPIAYFDKPDELHDTDTEAIGESGGRGGRGTRGVLGTRGVRGAPGARGGRGGGSYGSTHLEVEAEMASVPFADSAKLDEYKTSELNLDTADLDAAHAGAMAQRGGRGGRGRGDCGVGVRGARGGRGGRGRGDRGVGLRGVRGGGGTRGGSYGLPADLPAETHKMLDEIEASILDYKYLSPLDSAAFHRATRSECEYETELGANLKGELCAF